MRRATYFVILLVAGLAPLVVHSPLSATAAQPGCGFSAGFRSLHDAIPAEVGDCASEESFDSNLRESRQATTRGTLVWRELDNVAFFTDGMRTWAMTRDGVQSWPNNERAGSSTSPTAQVQVFFSHAARSADDFTAVFPVPRTAHGPRIASAALESLIEGPTTSEQGEGYFGDLDKMLRGTSACGASDFTLTVESGLATLRFCRAVVSDGVGQDARARAQIERTLGQFPSVERVRTLTTSGHCMLDETGLDLCLSASTRVGRDRDT